MRSIVLCATSSLLVVGSATCTFGQSPTAQLPYADGLALDHFEGCGGLVVASDGPFATGVAWQYAGVGSGGIGAFAARIQPLGPGSICSVALDLAQTGNYTDQPCDLFVWADEGSDGDTHPGAVLAVSAGVVVGPVASWPEVSKHLASIDGPCVEGPFWAGLVGGWSGEETPYYIAADLGPGAGESQTFIGPGLGYPSGWQSIDAVWEPIGALGIGVEIDPQDCGVDPVIGQSWGRIRTQFR